MGGTLAGDPRGRPQGCHILLLSCMLTVIRQQSLPGVPLESEPAQAHSLLTPSHTR